MSQFRFTIFVITSYSIHYTKLYEFKEDGTIKKVKPSLRGIGTPGIGDTVQVDRYSAIDGAQTTFVGGNEPIGWMVCETRNLSFVRFNRVNFGNGSVEKVKARVSSGQRIGSFEIRLNDAKGKLVAEFPVNYTGGWNNWITIETPILEKVEGTHDLVVVFKSEWGADKIVNLNWLIFQE